MQFCSESNGADALRAVSFLRLCNPVVPSKISELTPLFLTE
jgi:hypothetical protein